MWIKFLVEFQCPFIEGKDTLNISLTNTTFGTHFSFMFC